MSKDKKRELPKGWRGEKLGDAGKLSQGGTPSTEILDYWDGPIPFITGADVTSLYVSKGRSFLTETGLNSGKTERCEKGDLLIVSRIRVGRIGIADAVLGIRQDERFQEEELATELIKERQAVEMERKLQGK